MLKVIVVIPAYNEEGKIGNVVQKALSTVDAVLVIDDGSKDNTYYEAKNSGATVIRHKKNEGAGSAIRSGIEYSIKKNFDVCVPLSGDDQDDPKEIEKLIRHISNGYDFVQGSRYLRGGKTIDIPLFRLFSTKAFSIFFSLVTGYPIKDASNGFRAIRLDLFQDKRINIWQEWLNRYELEPYLLYKVIKLNYKFIEVPVTKKYLKSKGYTKMKPIIDWWGITKPIVYLALKIRE